MSYKPARERIPPERRSEIARHAARMRAMQRVLVCQCGHAEQEHWSIGERECRTCEIAEVPHPCLGFTMQ